MASKATDRYTNSLRGVPPLSLVSVVRDLRTGGISADTRDVIEAHGGRVDDPARVELPWGALARDLSVASGGGHYLVGSDVQGAHAALTPFSALVGAGVPVLSGLTGNVVVPRVSASSTAYWLSAETQAATESTPTLAQTTMGPKTFGVYTEFSRQLDLQSPAEAVLRRDLLNLAAKTLDLGALTGSGSSGEPTGLLNVPTIGTAAGAGITYATMLGMLEDVRDADANEASIVWLMGQDVYTLLAARVKVSGSDVIIGESNTIAGKRVVVSNNVPAATLVCMDASQALLGLWGGVQVELNPYASFAAGIKAARILVSMDVVLLTPATFVAATSVS